MSQEIEEVKSRADLVEIMQEYIKLIPAGTNFKAICPFHSEKTPSLMISPGKQIWKCFGCGEGGDVFKFLMKIEGLEFGEALRALAQRVGIKLSGHITVDGGQKEQLYRLLEWAARYWHKVLMESSVAAKAREYLKQRDIKEETIEDFNLGYAPDSWSQTSDFLVKRGFTEAEIFAAGLSVKKDRGSGFYDRFRGRLMFPIVDVLGRVVGFGGRTLDNSEAAKYINTPQTAAYNKSLVLYGLYRAKEEIRKKDSAIVVEGYMDVLPSHQLGIKNTVAISGTALTIEQVRMLKRYSVNMALALDMDAAGQNAAARSIETALAQEMNVKVITLPQGKDPGECIKNNPSDWLMAIGVAQEIMDYFFDQADKKYDFSKIDQKKLAVKFILEKISKLGSLLEQDHWLKEAAARFNTSESVLRELVKKTQVRHSGTAVKSKTADAIRNIEAKDLLLFKRLAALILGFPHYLSAVINSFSADFLQDKLAFGLYKKIVLFYTKNTDFIKSQTVDNLDSRPQSDLFNFFADWLKNNKPSQAELQTTDELSLLFAAELEQLTEGEIKAELNNLQKGLKEDYLKNKINILSAQLSQAERAGAAPEVINRIYQELSELIRQKS